ncbi:DUF992 domain-containing protein [Bradyrhizobium sp. BEA-2-5]|uniref:DUF992 domain-containing protein n=1 Tax=Bradyrhizobium TaxID=374 RepID=UPI00067B3894|nr:MULTISPECIES: DUF992 domain-containing protein [Bradyrhizobium]WOH81000.1 DUF992 domain-containing protein [Bradyrhizobium sp. BEA-2-5]
MLLCEKQKAVQDQAPARDQRGFFEMIWKQMRVRILAILCALCAWSGCMSSASAQQASWTQIGMLACKVDPSVGFVIFGHQSMSCRFTQNPPFPVQLYEGALNTVGIDIGVSAGGALGWAVLAPTAGPPVGALAGEYVGASGDIGLGLGAGVNVLVGGSGRSFALQPVSVEGSIAINVTVGLSGLQLRPIY